MIVFAEPEVLRLVTQGDHAGFSAELLGLWRSDGLPGHPRRSELLFATREHDNGWREPDAAPDVDPDSGRPHDFLTCPGALRMEIWDRGTARYAAERPYAALLITRHALALLPPRPGEPAWSEFLARLEERRRELGERLGHGAAELEADYRFLDLADWISLAACNGWEGTRERSGVRLRLAGGTLELDPFPLAGSTTFRVPCRRLPARRYRGAADLGGELATARWTTFTVRVAPFEGPAPAP